jgi:hypothetical protein
VEFWSVKDGKDEHSSNIGINIFYCIWGLREVMDNNDPRENE